MAIKVSLIFMCSFAAMAVCAVDNNRAANFVGLFNTNLGFFENFFSSRNIDNLQWENIPAGHLTTLRRIAITYSTLRGEFVTWCTYVNYTNIDVTNPKYENLTNMPEYDPTRDPNLFAHLTSKSATILHQMKQSLDAIKRANNGQSQARGNGETRYRRASTYNNHVLAEELVNLTPFNDDVDQALRIINQLLGMINNDIAIAHLNISQMKSKCKPVLDFTAVTL